MHFQHLALQFVRDSISSINYNTYYNTIPYNTCCEFRCGSAECHHFAACWGQANVQGVAVGFVVRERDRRGAFDRERDFDAGLCKVVTQKVARQHELDSVAAKISRNIRHSNRKLENCSCVHSRYLGEHLQDGGWWRDNIAWDASFAQTNF